jgi:hypothetical protein
VRYSTLSSVYVSAVRWIINLCSDLDRKWIEMAGGLAQRKEACE